MRCDARRFALLREVELLQSDVEQHQTEYMVLRQEVVSRNMTRSNKQAN